MISDSLLYRRTTNTEEILTMWTHAFLDWNGSLRDDDTLNYNALCHAFQFYKKTPPSYELYKRELLPDYKEFLYRYGFDRTTTIQEISTPRMHYMHKNPDQGPLSEGTRELLAWCEQHQIIRTLFTGEEPRVLLPTLMRWDMAACFEAIISGITPKMPLLEADIASGKIDLARSFLVDDNPAEIIVAKKLGITTFGITKGHSTAQAVIEAQPTFLVASPLEVLTILKGATQ